MWTSECCIYLFFLLFYSIFFQTPFRKHKERISREEIERRIKEEQVCLDNPAFTEESRSICDRVSYTTPLLSLTSLLICWSLVHVLPSNSSLPLSLFFPLYLSILPPLSLSIPSPLSLSILPDLSLSFYSSLSLSILPSFSLYSSLFLSLFFPLSPSSSF